jgi:antitoxin HigA-1
VCRRALDALSPEMAFRIEKAFGLTMETMLRMQAWHDAKAMRSRAGKIKVKPYHRPLAATHR